MKYVKKIVGEKVYLSPMCTEDVETYIKWMNDFSVTEGLGNGSNVVGLESEKEWLEETIKKGAKQFAIIDLEADKLIGNCGFNKIDNLRQTGEIGLFIGEETNRSKGYGQDALKLLIKFGFDYLNLKNIMLTVYSFNERGIQAYKKVGFKEFGRRHECYPLKGKRYDCIYMEMLEEDYRNK